MGIPAKMREVSKKPNEIFPAAVTARKLALLTPKNKPLPAKMMKRKKMKGNCFLVLRLTETGAVQMKTMMMMRLILAPMKK